MTASRVTSLACAVAALAAAASAVAEEPLPIRRVAFVVGANDGGRGRAKLRYAESDARAVADVLGRLGGVAPHDRILVLNPTKHEFVEGIERLRDLLAASQATTRRVELIAYYSGHSDEDGILLGEERYTYRDFRRELESLPADVRIAILDSCASGAMTRRKGGTWRPPFLVDDSSKVQGHAILTSSADDEAAQESDRLKASFFTHYLLSGLRGAADVTRDGKVTLNEAYQFAFNETLARTEQTQAGAQHPAYDIQLSGSGDLVMTDLRVSRAGLTVPADLEGRLFVREPGGRLAAELRKFPGQAVDLGLEPGEYVVTLLSRDQAYGARVALADGRRTELSRLQLVPLPKEATVSRGGAFIDPPLDVPVNGPAEGAAPEAARVPEPPHAPRVPDYPGERSPDAELATRDAPAPGDAEEQPFPPSEDESGYATIPVRFSLFPDVNTGAFVTTGKQIAQLSLNVIGKLEKVRGVEVGFANWISEDATGVQVAVGFNWVGRFARANQFAPGFNVVGEDARGVQGAAGFNIVGGAMNGLQLAPGFNISGGPAAPKDPEAERELMRLAQGAAGFNIAGGGLYGVQGAMGFNVAGGEVRGAQAAVGLNVSDGNTGVQLALVNISGDVTGAQVGLLNIAGTVKGAQVGLINISDDVIGVPIGLLNLSSKGLMQVDLFATDVSRRNIGVRLGSRYVYTVMATSLDSFSDLRGMRRWSTMLGLGFHIPRDAYYVEFDVVGTSRWAQLGDGSRIDTLVTPRFQVGWQPFRHLGVYGGLGVNVFTSAGTDGDDLGWGPQLVSVEPNGTTIRVWPALIAGIRI